MLADDPGAFGFLDPDQVIRACHIVPLFNEGKTAELMGPSRMRRKDDQMKDEDWAVYCVNM